MKQQMINRQRKERKLEDRSLKSFKSKSFELEIYNDRSFSGLNPRNR